MSDYRIIAPDLIGWGQSSHPAHHYRVDDYLNSVIEFLDRTCQAPVTAIASSLTAALIIRVAIAYPDRFKSLILVAPAGLKDFGNEVPAFFTQLLSVPILDRLIYWGTIANEVAIGNFLEQQTFAAQNESTQKLSMPISSPLSKPMLNIVRFLLCVGI